MAKSKTSAVVIKLLPSMEAKKAEIGADTSATAIIYHGYAADGTFFVRVRECDGCGSDHMDAATLVRETPGVEFVFRSTVHLSVIKHDVELLPE